MRLQSINFNYISPAQTQLSLSLCVHHSGRLTADTLDNAIERGRADYRSQSWFSIFIASCHAYCAPLHLCCIKSHHHMMENWFYWITLSAFFISSHKFDPDRKAKKRKIGEACLIFSTLMLNVENMISYDNFRSLFGWALLSEKKLAHWKIRKSSHFSRKFGSLSSQDEIHKKRRCWFKAKILQRLDACSHFAESQMRMKHRTEMSKKEKEKHFQNLVNFRSF